MLADWIDALTSFIDESPETIAEWHSSHLRSISSVGGWIAAGVITVPVALSAFTAGSYFENLSWPGVLTLGCTITTAAFLGGAGILSLIRLAKVVADLGRFHIRVDSHRFGILSTGTLLANSYLMGAGIWFIISLSASRGLDRRLIPIAILALPFLALLVGSFLWCQLPLHRKMLGYKRNVIYQIQNELDTMWALPLWELDSERRERIQFLERRLREVVALPEWPFRWQALTAVVASSLAPILPMLIQVVLVVVNGPRNP